MKTLLVKSAFTLVLVNFFYMVSAQSNEELRDKIININKEMAKAMMEGNTQATLNFYAQDAISLPNHGKMIKGVEAIKKSNEDMMSSGMKVNSVEFNTLMVNSYGNVISEIGTYKMNATMPGKDAPMEDIGKYLTLWEKQPDGSLKIKVEAWNTDTNPMEPNKE